MGLDIYLYEAAHHEQNERHEREWEALWGRKDRGEITEAEYDEQRKTITQWASHVDAPSAVDPSHLFNRRYLRSSYNEGGFNRIADNFGGHDLYWIFEPLGVEFDGWDGLLTVAHVEPLRECRSRALQVADEIRGWDRLRVTTIHGPLLGDREHQWSKPPTRDQVLDWAREELGRKHSMSGGYSCAKGEIFPDGFTLLAVTLGRAEFSFMSGPTVAYAVYRADDESAEHYTHSALITAEFCDEAIDLIERDGSAYMSWSG